MFEAVLSFIHISAVLAWIVFASAQAAICRDDWLNPAVVRRLGRLDTILWMATAAVLLSGLARIFLGAKGAGWYGSNWLLHVKITMFLVVAALQIGPTRHYRRWLAALASTGSLPSAEQLKSARSHVMIATHLMAVIPLPAVFLARGFGA